MPVVKSPDELRPTMFDGWTETTCASPEAFGEPVPVRVRRVVVDPDATAQVAAAGEEVMVYVVRGSGMLESAGERHRLDAEAVAWIDPPGPFALHAAGEGSGGGLEVLVTEAP